MTTSTVTYAKISPKMVNARDIAREPRRRGRKYTSQEKKITWAHDLQLDNPFGYLTLSLVSFPRLALTLSIHNAQDSPAEDTFIQPQAALKILLTFQEEVTHIIMCTQAFKVWGKTKKSLCRRKQTRNCLLIEITQLVSNQTAGKYLKYLNIREATLQVIWLSSTQNNTKSSAHMTTDFHKQICSLCTPHQVARQGQQCRSMENSRTRYTSSSSFAQTATQLALMNDAVRRRFRKGPKSLNLTGVLAAQVSAQSIWWVGQFCSRCSTVIGDVPQGQTAE